MEKYYSIDFINLKGHTLGPQTQKLKLSFEFRP